MRRTIALAAVLTLAVASAASAQAKPDFSGRWTVDTEKTAAANPGMPAGGPGGRGMMAGPITLTLEGNTLTRESEGRNGPVSTSYTLDGTERTVSMGMGEAKVKASWEGDRLNVVTVRETPNGSITMTSVYRRDGDWLVITTTAPMREGGEMTRTVYYRKG